jgi:hypothetical protein
MAVKNTMPQSYPRIHDEADPYYGFIDDQRLVPHSRKIQRKELSRIIKSAIVSANKKSSRVILNIQDDSSVEEVNRILVKEGQELFKYFVKYCGDPASTAIACHNHHYTTIAKEQFRNRTLQKERMNSGWRYQFIAKDGASCSQRFDSVSELGASEADFCVSIKTVDRDPKHVSIYTSVKNRTNTMGGQDWPKAIAALETVAKNDKNRTSPYLCVFGIAMEKGGRLVKQEQKTKRKYSHNTEIWRSDFFWPFFTNHSYEEIIQAVLDVLIEVGEKDNIDIEIPESLIESFGACCREHDLLDDNGMFHDPYRLVKLFVGNRQSRNKE